MIERLLASKTNRLLAAALFVLLVILPCAGVNVPMSWQLVGGNFTNVTGYLAASIAAGASVVNLHEGRQHRRRTSERLDAIHTHLTKQPPRTGRTRKETAP